MRAHAADLFDQAQKHLCANPDERAAHPVLILDDAEGMSVESLDILRRLTAYSLDAEDRFSVLISGTEDLLRVLRHPVLESLRTRIGFACSLKPFSLDDTRNYVAFQLKRADADAKLFSDDALRRLFQASQGRPRQINQLAVHVLIQAAVMGFDAITGDFFAAQLTAHPLYDPTLGAAT
jgi:type II secretory pathway predicted ATPase ExeA